MEKDYLRVNIAAVATNQHALDFEGNKNRIFRSIEMCKTMGCTYRAGGECEVSGYSCEDHFKELDTIYHCWEIVGELLSTDLTVGIIVEMNMPVIHRSVCYNCKVLCCNRKIICVRPKTEMADENIYRESRYFIPWVPRRNNEKKFVLEEFALPNIVTRQTGQKTCPFGLSIIQALDCSFGLEICQELWLLNNNPGKLSFMNNADFVVSCNGSCYVTDKLKNRVDMVRSETKRMGGAYVYVNLIGCDGTNLYFDGGNVICQNGKTLAVGAYHTLNEIEIVNAVLNLQKIRLERHAFTSGQRQSQDTVRLPVIPVEFKLCKQGINYTAPIEYSFDSGAQQNAECITSYLWDYLRKSGAGGFFVTMGGDMASTTNAMLVHYLCYKVFKEINEGNAEVLVTLRKIVKKKDFRPKSVEEISKLLLVSSHLPYQDKTEQNRTACDNLTTKLGGENVTLKTDNLTASFVQYAKENLNLDLKNQSAGGNWDDEVNLQNLEDRIRMVLTYLIAQCVPLGRKNQDGFLIVLANGNTADALMGCSTKYGVGSGDISPLGSLNKSHIHDIFEFLQNIYGWDEMKAYEEYRVKQRPSNSLSIAKAESGKNVVFLSAGELETLYKFRSDRFCGPFSMFDNLSEFWPNTDPEALEMKIENFFKMYCTQRHKSVTGTPNVHCSVYSCDPKSKDVRPMLYGGFHHQFSKMKKLKNQVIMSKKSKKYIMENLEYTRFQLGDGDNSQYSDAMKQNSTGHDTHTPFNYMT
jgi:NAD+ synthase (glutamine-hydrolysing)